MSWVTVIWAMVAASCLTLTAVHFPVRVKNPAAWPSLCFSVLAVSTAALACCELDMMHAQTPAAYAAALCAANLAVSFITTAFVGFVQTYFKGARLASKAGQSSRAPSGRRMLDWPGAA